MRLDHFSSDKKKSTARRYFNVASGAYWSKDCGNDEVRWIVIALFNGERRYGHFSRMQSITIPAVSGDMRCITLGHIVIVLLNNGMMVVVRRQALVVSYLLSISVNRGSDNGCCSYNNANRMLTRHIKSKH
jgi:hypothetical protein